MKAIRKLPNLLTAHMDAWGTTFIIGAMCLVLHGASAWSLVIAVTVGYWLGFAVNDYYDAPYDALDPKKAARGYFTQVTLPPLLVRVIFIVIAVLLVLPFLSFGVRGIVVFAVALVILWAYSAPPLRLKSVPGFDIVTHALFVQTFPYVIPLFLLNLALTPLDFTLIAACLLASTSSQLEQQARDYEVDRLNERNFTTLIGRDNATRLMKIITVILTVFLVINTLTGVIPAFLAPFEILCLPLVIHRVVRRADQPRSEGLFRVTTVAALIYALGLLLLG